MSVPDAARYLQAPLRIARILLGFRHHEAGSPVGSAKRLAFPASRIRIRFVRSLCCH